MDYLRSRLCAISRAEMAKANGAKLILTLPNDVAPNKKGPGSPGPFSQPEAALNSAARMPNTRPSTAHPSPHRSCTPSPRPYTPAGARRSIAGRRRGRFRPLRRLRRVGRAAIAGPEHDLNRPSGNAGEIAPIRVLARRLGQRPHARRVTGRHESDVQLWIIAAAGPVRRRAGDERAEITVDVGKAAGHERIWRILVALDHLDRLLPQLRREVDEVIGEIVDVPRVAQRFLREGLRRPGLLARHVGLRDGPLDDRPDRLARRAVEDVKPALLGRSRDDLSRAALDRDVGREGGRRHVEMPDRMRGEREVPLGLPGPQIDRDQPLAVEIGTRPVAAVIVRRRRLDREIDEAEVLID